MAIKVLDPQLVSQIAAGEVIERPASVVKELVENSIDAGATSVAIEVHNGGMGLIRVTDNGRGIASEEVAIAFRRHATSKLKDLSDLEQLRFLGFRGEALPAIAAVADVEITTSCGDVAGTYVKFSAGVPGESSSRAHPCGTTIAAHHLFHTTPARLKFMKSERAEAARATYLISQFVLAFPEVRFTLSVDGRTTLQSTGSGRLIDAVAQVYGADVAAEMLEIAPAPSVMSPGSDSLLPVVSGLVSPPQLSRSNRSYMSFFVNRRWVYDRSLARAVDEAYQGLLMTGRQPIVVLNVAVSPAAVDVNVHPTKHEVRFRHENLVFSTVNRAVRQALSTAPVPRLTIPQYGSPWEDGSPNAWQAQMPVAMQPPGPQPRGWPEEWDRQSPSESGLRQLRVLGQIDNTYIVAESPGGLYLVDQHAAHERILFDKIRMRRPGETVEVQALLEPVVLELAPGEEDILRARAASLSALGFAIEAFGERSCLVRAVPAVLASADIAGALREILSSGGKIEDQEWLDGATASLACHGAIKAGQRLDGKEAAELLSQLEETTSPRTCPHGRPTMIHLSSGELRRHFGRA